MGTALGHGLGLPFRGGQVGGGAAPAADHLLLEDGTDLLLEDGSLILLE